MTFRIRERFASLQVSEVSDEAATLTIVQWYWSVRHLGATPLVLMRRASSEVCARTHEVYQHRHVAFARLVASAICEAILSLPAGTLLALIGIAALNVARSYVASEENNKTFGREQSFVAGSPTDAYLQFMVEDSKKYAATGGWGFGDFKDGEPGNEALMKTCFACHVPAKDHDFVFTRYAH